MKFRYIMFCFEFSEENFVSTANVDCARNTAHSADEIEVEIYKFSEGRHCCIVSYIDGQKTESINFLG